MCIPGQFIPAIRNNQIGFLELIFIFIQSVATVEIMDEFIPIEDPTFGGHVDSRRPRYTGDEDIFVGARCCEKTI